MTQPEDKLNNLKKWIDSMEQYEPASWERLPELELYMDQVITFMNRQLEPFSTGGERLLTPSMINNYVKDGVLPRPEKKKYNRSHIALLSVICSLKTVLSLPEIDALIHGLTQGRDVESQYPEFAAAQHRALDDVVNQLKTVPEQDAEARYRWAIRLALEANARASRPRGFWTALPSPGRSRKRKKTRTNNGGRPSPVQEKERVPGIFAGTRSFSHFRNAAVLPPTRFYSGCRAYG